MSKGKLVVFEGCDGSGKSTQVELFQNHLRSTNISFRYLHFPTETTVYGGLIQDYLFYRGDIAEMGEINPYFISTLYANDRYRMKPVIEKWLDEVDIVIIDRYVYSNYALIGGQLSNDVNLCPMSDRDKYFEWLSHYEFEQNKLHIPDIVIYLNMPLKFIKENMEKRETQDIHENLEVQKNAKEVYDNMVDNEIVFSIECGECGKLLTEREIHNRITELLKEKNII